MTRRRTTPQPGQREFGRAEAVELGVVRGVRGWGPRRLRCYTHAPREPGLAGWVFAPLSPPGDCLELYGMHRFPWGTGVNIARCLTGRGGCTPPPEPARVGLDCRCGFYAYWGDTGWVSWFGKALVWDGVLGVIEGHGTTVIGEKGFRCQRARILALTMSRDDADTDRARAEVAALTRHYGVPVYDQVDRMLAAHPPDEGPVT